MKLLLIEDQPNIVNTLYHSLNDLYTIHIAGNAQAALQKLKTYTFNAITLDLGLPDMHGATLCHKIRTMGVATPILVISRESSVRSKVDLLDMGANDYITKPFDISEVEARLRAMLRGRVSKNLSDMITVGDLTVDTARHTVSRSGVPISLRRKEYAFLECLVQNAGTVVSKSLLEALVWDDQPQTMTNTIHVQVTNLRRKIDKPFGRQLIHTVHGIGYRLEE